MTFDTRARIALCFLAFVFFRARAVTAENRALRGELQTFRSLQSLQARRSHEVPKSEAEPTPKTKTEPEPETDEMRELLARRKRTPGEGRPGDQAVVEELRRRWAAGEGSGSQEALDQAAAAGADLPKGVPNATGGASGVETAGQRPRSPPPPPPPRRRVVAQDIWVAGPSSRKV
ncbi:hypothetical protein HWV62_31013 [Athelia sp. TMB]|nr:hypothetical protein HWV62_31013 [Athelia sp. TMB]